MLKYNTSFISLIFLYLPVFTVCAVGLVSLVRRRASLLEGQSFSFTFLSCSAVPVIVLHIFDHSVLLFIQFFCLLHLDVILYSLTVFCFINRNETFWQGHHVWHVRKLYFLSVWDDVISLIFPVLIVERFLLIFLDNLLFNRTWPVLIWWFRHTKQCQLCIEHYICKIWEGLSSLLQKLYLSSKLHSLGVPSKSNWSYYIWEIKLTYVVFAMES